MELRPNSKPQEDFFAASEYEVLYGGAAGGGKSFALVVDPMRYVGYSKFTGIIFRRTYPELEGSILPLMYDLYPQAGGVYRETRKEWRFPSGATIRLGYMEHREDWRSYQGHEYAYQGYDELTNFLEEQYTMLAAWNRSKQEGVPGYRRCASNPGGVGHAWVKARFVDVCKPIHDGPERFSPEAKIHWQPMRSGPTFWSVDTKTGQRTSRKFIPARVFDNSDLLRINPNYLGQLLELPEEKRKALIEGDWDVYEGQFFSKWRRDIHGIQHYQRMPRYPVLGGLDYGMETVLEVAYMDYEGNLVFFLENYTKQESPQARANRIADALIEKDLKRLPIVYDTNMDISLEYYTGGNKTPSETFREVFQTRMGPDAPLMRVVSKKSSDKKDYRVITNEAFRSSIDWEYGPDGKIIKKPKLYVVARNCPMLMKSIPELVYDPDSAEGLDFIKDGSVFDHPFDAAKMVLMDLRVGREAAKPLTWEQRFAKQSTAVGWEVGMG